MAISLEELALGALEGSAGPWTLAVGAGALAVALAAGSARPMRRMALTGTYVAQRTGQLNVAGWIGSMRTGWRDLVAEARAEYDAERAATTNRPVQVAELIRGTEPAGTTPAPADDVVVTTSAAAATADADPVADPSTLPLQRVVAEDPAASPSAAFAPEAPAQDATLPDDESAASTRDRRGRFVRRSVTSNGTHAE